jgi:uncharacterized repeat protein (TIGR03803 family)
MSKFCHSKQTVTASTILALTLTISTLASAQQEAVLHNFAQNGVDGASPNAGVILDKAGNLYGTTTTGGTASVGTVYELSPVVGGGWTERILHSFNNDGVDGQNPASSLVFDAGGNLYGTTLNGGKFGGGTVFELSPNGGGGWRELVLANFSNDSAGGGSPASGVSFDREGNLFGTLSSGGLGTGCGSLGCGTVYELVPKPGGGWHEKTVHSFTNDGIDGYHPTSGLVNDVHNNLYGVTNEGGTANQGTVYQLSPKTGGGWSISILHSFSFNGTDGYYPNAGVTLDANGNLYGTTHNGGAFSSLSGGGGTVYELSPAVGESWTENILASFDISSTGPVYPISGVVMDSSGALYGSTYQGGTNGEGVTYKLQPAQGGWTQTILHNFQNNGRDGMLPVGNLTIRSSHVLYGVTSGGGGHKVGTVFAIVQ